MRLHNEPVYRCRHCLDQGLITVFRIESMRAVAGDPDYAGPLLSCGVRCPCAAGAKWQSAGVFFDPNHMVPCEYRPTEADREALREHQMQAHAGTTWTGEGHACAAAGETF